MDMSAGHTSTLRPLARAPFGCRAESKDQAPPPLARLSFDQDDRSDVDPNGEPTFRNCLELRGDLRETSRVSDMGHREVRHEVRVLAGIRRCLGKRPEDG